MSTRVSVILSLLAGLVVGCSVTSMHKDQAGSEARFAERTRVILNMKDVPLHKRIRDLWVSACRFGRLKGPQELEDALQNAGFVLDKTYTKPWYYLKEARCKTSSGPEYGVYLYFGRFDSDIIVRPRFVASLNAPHRLIVNSIDEGDKSILKKIMLQQKVMQAAAKYPFVKEFSIEYGLLGDKWLNYQPYAYHVRVELVGHPNEPLRGEMSFGFTVISNLDPPESWDGEKKLLEGFTPNDLLGEVTSWGGGETYPHFTPDWIQ